MKVYCPTTKIAPETREALNRTGVDWEDYYVGGDEEGYFKLLSRLWGEREDFIIVEQDIIVPTTIFGTFVTCPMDWCAGTYTYLNGQDYAGLGCVRFRKELMIALPDLMERVGGMSNNDHKPRHWCLTPESRVLLIDGLRWIPLGAVKPGDVILGIDEHSGYQPTRPYRKYQPATVEAAVFVSAPVVRIILSDGTEMRATADHQFLTTAGQGNRWLRTKWVAAADLVPGRHRLQRYLLPAPFNPSREAGYLAGLFDGEGTMYGTAQALSFGQRPGRVLDTGRRLIEDLGYETRLADNGHGVKVVFVAGSMAERLHFLSSIRPERLISKINFEALGKAVAFEKVGVEAIEPAGNKEVIQLQTSARTFISEGFLSHNCTLDAWMQIQLHSAGAFVHCHEHVGHLHDWPTHGCVPRPEANE